MSEDMTPEQRIDAALALVFMGQTHDERREAMRKIMSDSYIAGSNDHFKAMQLADGRKSGNKEAA